MASKIWITPVKLSSTAQNCPLFNIYRWQIVMLCTVDQCSFTILKTSILHILLQRNSYSILSLLWYDITIFILNVHHTLKSNALIFIKKINLNSKYARLWVSMVHRAFIEINQTTNQIHLLGRAAMPACLYRSFLFCTLHRLCTCCCNVVVVR